MLKSIFMRLRSSRGKTMNESIAYARGIDAFHEGEDRTENPYDPRYSEWDEWDDGWYDASGMSKAA